MNDYRRTDKRLLCSWRNIKKRCLNPSYHAYERYGGRGIKLCESWLDYENFKKDMLPTYKDNLTIDRIDNNLGYSPENCRWATMKEQCNNRSDNHRFKWNGLFLTLSEWSDRLNIKRGTLATRVYTYRWSLDRVFTTGGRIV